MTRITAAQNAAAIAELRTAVEALTVVVTALVPAAPAKRTTTRAKAAPAKAPAKKAPAKKAPAKAVTLRKATRKAFVKANPWAAGLSTKEIATEVVLAERVEENIVSGPFVLADGYRTIAEAALEALGS